MQQSALEAINTQRAVSHRAPQSADDMQTLRLGGQYEIIGTREGGFAVVSSDDLLPEVLGVSAKRYSEGRNTNFEWWLKAVGHVADYAVENNIQLATTKPDPAKYPTAVPPMLTTEWDQLTPYNNLLPLSQGGDRVYTGCVATAMAQVLNYHQTPEHGYGQRTVYYPQYDQSGSAITATFEDDYYDWDNMLDRYDAGYYTQAQAQAVALLMRDCGVAANMAYGGAAESGSGAFSQDAAAGLRLYFGLAEAECLERDNYSESRWMDIVYRELSENGPLYYGGASYESGGHAFVLHGYNADGKVYVNWGWSGEDDGYYDIALLNPGYYHFELQQDMIVGVKGEPRNLTDEDIALEQPGMLSTLLGDDKIGTVGTLKVTGDINAADLRQIRRLAGVDEYGERTKGCLKTLDLSAARFVGGGHPYLIDGSKQLTMSADTLPARAFYGCRYLKSVKLPDGLKSIGEGAFALCGMLDTVDLGKPAADADFVVDNGIVWSTDRKEIVAVLPHVSGKLVIPSGTTRLRNYALSGCARLSSVTIPATVEWIGREALNGCSGITEIRVGSEEPPTLGGANVFKGITVWTCQLYVPSGSETKYAKKAQWGDFRGDDYDNIIGFGSSVKVRNTIRYYGQENPTFTYSVQGDPVTGTPVLMCEATKDSPAGRYPIVITKGTITTDNVKYIDGYMIVQKVKATATVLDAVREEGEENPAFTLAYEGLVNGDTVPVWLKEPVITTTATSDSPAGEYTIVVESAQAESYNLSFVAGTLTVKKRTSGIETLTVGDKAAAASWYDLQGRRVDEPKKKGLYICRGRKVVR